MSEKAGAVLEPETDAAAEYNDVVGELEAFMKSKGAKYEEEDDGGMKPDDMVDDEDDEAMKKMKGHKEKEPSEEFMKMAKMYGYSKGDMKKSIGGLEQDDFPEEVRGLDPSSEVDGEKAIAGFERTLAKSIAGMTKKHDETSLMLAKSLKSVMEQVGALQKEVEAFGSGPRPRKSRLDVMHNSTAGAPGQEGRSADEIMAKAVKASNDGRITPADVSMTRMYLQAGSGEVPAGLLKQIIGD